MNAKLDDFQNGRKPAQKRNGVRPSKGAKGQRPQSAMLSPRQTEIAQLVARGLTDKEIGSKLQMTEGTVGWHLNQIFLKWQVHSRVALTVRFLQETPPKRMASDSPPTNVRVVATSCLLNNV
jgi:DNA-binding NarL/FixJ family response regulator